jgi:hypothetical protein
MARGGLAALLSVVLAACQASPSAETSGAGSTGSAASASGTGSTSTGGTTTGGAAPAPTHFPFPQVPNHPGAPLLTTPKLVSVMFPGYAFESQEVAFQQWVMTSDWIAQVGAEYGIGKGSFAGNFVLDAGAPANDAALQHLLAIQMAEGGALPAPDANTVYAVFIPLSSSFATQYCAEGASSYHEQSLEGPGFPYIVVIDCAPDVTGTDGALYVGALESHEIVEAATDPDPLTGPAWRFDPTSPWYLEGGEVADLCAADWVLLPDAGVEVQRIWSNIAAADGGVAPCAPGSDFNVATQFPDAGDLALVPVGGSASVSLLGWAPAPVANWSISLYPLPPPYSQFTVTAKLSATTVGIGGTVEVQVSVPSSAKPGQEAAILLIYTDPVSATEEFRWLIGVQATD